MKIALLEEVKAKLPLTARPLRVAVGLLIVNWVVVAVIGFGVKVIALSITAGAGDPAAPIVTVFELPDQLLNPEPLCARTLNVTRDDAVRPPTVQDSAGAAMLPTQLPDVGDAFLAPPLPLTEYRT